MLSTQARKYVSSKNNFKSILLSPSLYSKHYSSNFSRSLSVYTLSSSQVACRLQNHSCTITSLFLELNSKALVNSRTFSSKKADVESLRGEWLKYQESLEVKQDDTARDDYVDRISSLGNRFGKQTKAMKKNLREKLKQGNKISASEIGGGQYPSERLSDEETERLLTEAFEGIPKRAGKRGTNNLRRQRRRWHLVRKIRKKIKLGRIKNHFKRMQKRSDKVKAIQVVKAGAADIRRREEEYQMIVLKGWALRTFGLENVVAANDTSSKGNA